jgi:hypothetical protein
VTAQRLAGTLLTTAALVAAVLTGPAGPSSRHSRAVHGCQAGAAGGPAAAIEAEGVPAAAQLAASTASTVDRCRSLFKPTASSSPLDSGFTFARPHDPGHLHAFALLI